MSGNTGVAQGDREIAGFKTFQYDACIDDRTVEHGAIQRVAERLGRSGNVVEQPGKPEVRVAHQSEAEEWIVQCLGRKLQKPDLARNADPNVFPVDLAGRQTGAFQQRLEHNARLAQAYCRQSRTHAQSVRLQAKLCPLGPPPGLTRLSNRSAATSSAHRSDPWSRHARAN